MARLKTRFRGRPRNSKTSEYPKFVQPEIDKSMGERQHISTSHISERGSVAAGVPTKQ